MEPLFDIDLATNNFSAVNAERYILLIKSASCSELKGFKKQVLKHKKIIIKSSARYGRPALLEHWYIISAINHELLKRSWRYKVYKFIFPFRQWLVKTFSNIDLSEDIDTGSRYDQIEQRSSIWHLSHKELAKSSIEFWLNRWPVLLPIIVGAAVALFINFNSSSNSAGESKQKENHQVTSINHVNPHKS